MSHPLKSTLYALSLIIASLLPFVAVAQLQEFKSFGGTAPESLSLLAALRFIVNAFLALAGLAAAIYMVLAGVRYVTSQGDEDETSQAKMSIIYGAVGIIVILLSGVLVNFVMNSWK